MLKSNNDKDLCMSTIVGNACEGLSTTDVAKVLGPVAMEEEDEEAIEEGEPLLAEGDVEKTGLTWRALAREMKSVSFMAAPMVVVSVSQYVLEVVSMIMAGHLNELSLSAVAIANCFVDITGNSLIHGMAGALETLCGQAYGAEQYHKVRIYTYCSIICLTMVCFPVSLLWIFEEKLLLLLGQDPSVSNQAWKYSVFLIPALFADATLTSLILYLQTQGLTFGMVATSLAVLCFHVPVCWALVYKFKLGIVGAALSLGLSYWLYVVLLAIYIKTSRVCHKTYSPFTNEVFFSIREYFRFALPSACMACLEWWSFELLILLSGTLPNSKLETSVLSICFTIISLHHLISCGIGAATSTRVSNELGAGNPYAAQAAVYAGVILSVVEAILLGTALFCNRNVLGYVYSNEKEVVRYVAELTPLLSLSFLMDGLQAVLCGVARASGWQNLGAYVNLGAFYLFGCPVAVVLGFLLNMRGYGIWIGLLVGSTIQALLLALITYLTNWQKKVTEARERIFEHTRAGCGGKC